MTSLCGCLVCVCLGLLWPSLLGGLLSPAPSQPAPLLHLTCSTCSPSFISSSLTDKQCQIFKSLCVSSVQCSLVCLPDVILFLPHGFLCPCLALIGYLTGFWTLTCFCALTTALCLFTGFINLRACVTLSCCHLTTTPRS
ncbi:hypothetical protein AMECASPLE_020040 [Ameca splendens]|uniref:Uncharacterized protein n=1 Tax=Ameca splendens TaxID=208324 RepID=A0ABV1A0W2_9TELE